jgi:hypothetical protein
MNVIEQIELKHGLFEMHDLKEDRKVLEDRIKELKTELGGNKYFSINGIALFNIEEELRQLNIKIFKTWRKQYMIDNPELAQRLKKEGSPVDTWLA